MTADSPVLDLRSASFGYAGRTVVSRADLAIRAGESVALLGANGCGKSTLSRGLLGLTEQLGGEVLVLGRPLTAKTRASVGYVPQRHTLSTSVVATVGEIVSMGGLARRGLRPATRRDRARVEEALDLVGLPGMARHDVTHLSGGQQRRVLVARALVAQPRVLVMDEPTAGVDESNQHMLAGTMRRLTDDGVALLTVTHDLEALAPAIDRVVTMQAGRIVADVPAASYVPAGHAGHAHHLPTDRLSAIPSSTLG